VLKVDIINERAIVFLITTMKLRQKAYSEVFPSAKHLELMTKLQSANGIGSVIKDNEMATRREIIKILIINY
jgi:hypothetical protein